MNLKSVSLFATLLAVNLAVGVAAAAGASPRAALKPASVCPDPATWTRVDGEHPRRATAGSIYTDMAKRDVVLLGERHDADDDHRWQLQTLSALHAERPDMVIGFEMFPRRLQPVLDRWVAGELTARQFLEQSEWDKVWALPSRLYLPLFEFARINRIPMLALNIEGKLSRAIAEKGWDAVAAAEREGVGRAAAPVDAYRDVLREVYGQHKTGRNGAKARQIDGSEQSADKGFGYFVESQTTWDRAMAEALARHGAASQATTKPLMVGIMGSGHLRFGYGVPHQLRDLGVRNIGILIPVAADAACTIIRPGLADAVFVLPKQAAAAIEPPRLGVTLESGEGKEGKVGIAEVTSDSLAARSGLKKGDRLLAVAGQAAQNIPQIIAAIRRQPGGTWLPLQILRGDETLDLVVKFPAGP